MDETAKKQQQADEASRRMHEYLERKQRRQEEYWLRKYGKVLYPVIPKLETKRAFEQIPEQGGFLPPINGAAPRGGKQGQGQGAMFQAAGPIKTFPMKGAKLNGDRRHNIVPQGSILPPLNHPTQSQPLQEHANVCTRTLELNEAPMASPNGPFSPGHHSMALKGSPKFSKQLAGGMLAVPISGPVQLPHLEHSRTQPPGLDLHSGAGDGDMPPKSEFTSPKAEYHKRAVRDLQMELAVLKTIKGREDVLDRLRTACDKITAVFGASAPSILSSADPLVRLFYRLIGTLRARTLDCVECIVAWRRKTNAREPFVYYGNDYMANIGPDLQFLDDHAFLSGRLMNTKAAGDPFLVEVTPDGVPIEEASTMDLRRGNHRFTSEALRIHMARKALASYRRQLSSGHVPPADRPFSASSFGSAAEAGYQQMLEERRAAAELDITSFLAPVKHYGAPSPGAHTRHGDLRAMAASMHGEHRGDQREAVGLDALVREALIPLVQLHMLEGGFEGESHDIAAQVADILLDDMDAASLNLLLKGGSHLLVDRVEAALESLGIRLKPHSLRRAASDVESDAVPLTHDAMETLPEGEEEEQEEEKGEGSNELSEEKEEKEEAQEEGGDVFEERSEEEEGDVGEVELVAEAVRAEGQEMTEVEEVGAAEEEGDGMSVLEEGAASGAEAEAEAEVNIEEEVTAANAVPSAEEALGGDEAAADEVHGSETADVYELHHDVIMQSMISAVEDILDVEDNHFVDFAVGAMVASLEEPYVSQIKAGNFTVAGWEIDRQLDALIVGLDDIAGGGEEDGGGDDAAASHNYCSTFEQYARSPTRVKASNVVAPWASSAGDEEKRGGDLTPGSGHVGNARASAARGEKVASTQADVARDEATGCSTWSMPSSLRASDVTPSAGGVTQESSASDFQFLTEPAIGGSNPRASHHKVNAQLGHRPAPSLSMANACHSLSASHVEGSVSGSSHAAGGVRASIPVPPGSSRGVSASGRGRGSASGTNPLASSSDIGGFASHADPSESFLPLPSRDGGFTASEEDARRSSTNLGSSSLAHQPPVGGGDVMRASTSLHPSSSAHRPPSGGNAMRASTDLRSSSSGLRPCAGGAADTDADAFSVYNPSEGGPSPGRTASSQSSRPVGRSRPTSSLHAEQSPSGPPSMRASAISQLPVDAAADNLLSTDNFNPVRSFGLSLGIGVDLSLGASREEGVGAEGAAWAGKEAMGGGEEWVEEMDNDRAAELRSSLPCFSPLNSDDGFNPIQSFGTTTGTQPLST